MRANNKYDITNAWLCQIQGDSIEPVFCDFTIDGGIIKSISQKNYDAFLRKPQKVKSNQYNAGGRVVTTPLVNFHDHIYSRLAKGLPTLGPMDNFHNVLKNLWWQLDKALDTEMIKASAQMAAMESIRNGVTYIFDHHASPIAAKGSLFTISSVLKDFNLCGAICYEISDRDGAVITRQAIDETISFINEGISENIRTFVGLHASFTLKDETLELASKIVNSFNLGIHIHLCEDIVDRQISIEEYKLTPIERLRKYNLLNVKSILSHGIHLTENDYSTILREGCALAYNACSNMNNSVGVPEFNNVPLQIPIVTGTDGMHANIAKSMKQLFLLFRHQKNDFGKTFDWFIKLYFDQLKFVRQYFPAYPSLEKGDRADLIMWDYIPPTPFDASNFWGHYIYGILERPVKNVIQNGEFLMKDFILTIKNEDQLSKDIFFQGNRLKEKIEQNKS